MELEKEIQELKELRSTLEHDINYVYNNPTGYSSHGDCLGWIGLLSERRTSLKEHINNCSDIRNNNEIIVLINELLNLFTQLQTVIIATYAKQKVFLNTTSVDLPKDNFTDYAIIGNDEITRLMEYLQTLDIKEDSQKQPLSYYFTLDPNNIMNSVDLWKTIAECLKIWQFQDANMPIVCNENRGTFGNRKKQFLWGIKNFRTKLNPKAKTSITYEQLKDIYDKNGATAFLKALSKADLKKIYFPKAILDNYEEKLNNQVELSAEEHLGIPKEPDNSTCPLDRNEKLWINLPRIADYYVEHKEKIDIGSIFYPHWVEDTISFFDKDNNDKVTIALGSDDNPDFDTYYIRHAFYIIKGKEGIIKEVHMLRPAEIKLKERLFNVRTLKMLTEIDELFGTNCMTDYKNELLSKTKVVTNKSCISYDYLTTNRLDIFIRARRIEKVIDSLSQQLSQSKKTDMLERD